MCIFVINIKLIQYLKSKFKDIKRRKFYLKYMLNKTNNQKIDQ